MNDVGPAIWPITAKKEIVCPNCRSKFYIIGAAAPGVSQLQDIYCPVCGQKIWVNTVKIFGIGKKWVADGVIKKGPQPIPHPVPAKSMPTPPSPSPTNGYMPPSKIEPPEWVKVSLVVGGVVIGGLVLIKIFGD